MRGHVHRDSPSSITAWFGLALCSISTFIASVWPSCAATCTKAVLLFDGGGGGAIGYGLQAKCSCGWRSGWSSARTKQGFTFRYGCWCNCRCRIGVAPSLVLAWFGLASCSSLKHSAWPFCAATNAGVAPSLVLAWFGSALYSNSAFTQHQSGLCA